MTLMRHKSLLPCLGGRIDKVGDDAVLVMPLMKQSLYSKLHCDATKEGGGLNWIEKIKIAKSIAEGMIFLHRFGILHRDLKSLNVLINDVSDVKLIDFGLARVRESNMTKAVGTTSWMAPEVLFGQPYSFSADVYSFAIVLWELLTLREPYEDVTIQVYDYIRKGGRPTLPKKPTSVQKMVIKLIQKYWNENPKKRGTFEEVLQDLQTLEKEIE